jgi:hypothetical protein
MKVSAQAVLKDQNEGSCGMVLTIPQGFFDTNR